MSLILSLSLQLAGCVVKEKLRHKENDDAVGNESQATQCTVAQGRPVVLILLAIAG